jgi:hypothetical protein
MKDQLVVVYDYKDPQGENPDWIWRGTDEHIAGLGLEPIPGSMKQVPAGEIDETGRYRPEMGTGQQ